jgi:hypothetical protein
MFWLILAIALWGIFHSLLASVTPMLIPGLNFIWNK